MENKKNPAINRNKKLIKIFSEVLTKLRKQKDFSQEELAFLIKSSRSFISDLECANKQPSLSTLFRIAQALQLKLSDLALEIEKELESKE